MDQTLFIIISLLGALYFLAAKRNFDYFTVGFFSALIYFLPGFFGSTAYHVGGVWREKAIHPEAYAIMIVVLSSIILFALLGSRVSNPFPLNIKIPLAEKISVFILFLAVLGLIGLLASSGSQIHDPDKNTVMESLGRWHILFYTAATLGLPIAYLNNQKALVMLFLCFLIFDLYIGFRSALAIGVLSTLVVALSRKNPSRLVMKELRLIMLSLIVGFFFFGYKTIAFAVKAGMWDLVLAQVGDPDAYKFIFLRSEPFIIQHILNEVVSSNFKTGLDHVLSVFNQFMIMSPELGLVLPSFNSLFQPTLFPEVEYGMASNVWAQLWSAGGWFLVIIFIVLFNIMLAVGNATLKSSSVFVKAAAAPMFCYLAFYMHRNDLSYTLNIEKRLFLILLIVVCFAYLIKHLAPKTQ